MRRIEVMIFSILLVTGLFASNNEGIHATQENSRGIMPAFKVAGNSNAGENAIQGEILPETAVKPNSDLEPLWMKTDITLPLREIPTSRNQDQIIVNDKESRTKLDHFGQDRAPGTLGFTLTIQAYDVTTLLPINVQIEKNFVPIGHTTPDTFYQPGMDPDPYETHFYDPSSFWSVSDPCYGDWDPMSVSFSVILGDYNIYFLGDPTSNPIPNPPTNLVATALSNTQVTVSWMDNSDNEEYFALERKIGISGAWEDIIHQNLNATSYVDTGLTPGTTYYYRVKACVDCGGCSLYSNEDSATTPLYSAPVMIQIERFNSLQVIITWEALPNALSYVVFAADNPLPVGSPGWSQIAETSNTYCIVNSSAPKKFFYVRAFSSSWMSEDFVYVPGGTFLMGDTRGVGYSDELPVHSVTLSPFYMGKYEVTQAEWLAVMGSNPAYDSGVGDNYPVYYVNWYSAICYCNLRSIMDNLTPCYTINGSTDPNNWGSVPTAFDPSWNAVICDWIANGYRLPTEAEWEYAARGATNNPDYLYSGSNDINTVAWFDGNLDLWGVKPVGTKMPNGIGLFDMSGNVHEYCWDWYSDSYYYSSPFINPTGPGYNYNGRVARGGYFNHVADICRVSSRNTTPPYWGFLNAGFRLCRSQ